MARQLPGDLGQGRGGDVHLLNPLSDNLVVDEKKFNSSRFEPVTPAGVRALAEMIVVKAEETDKHGQLQAVVVRKLDKETYTLSAGFTRYKALRLINEDEGFRQRLGLAKGETYPLRCEIKRQNEDDALMDNMDENLVRNELSPMDKAKCVATFVAKGWTHSDISKRFPRLGTANWCGQLEKLFELDKPLQMMVHKNELGVQAAIDLTDIPVDDRGEVLDQARAEARGKQTVNGATIRSAKRDKAIERAEKTGEEVTGTKPRSIRELRKFLEEQSDKATGHPEEVRKLYAAFLGFVNGKKSERQVSNAVDKVADTMFEEVADAA